ncbi:GNAT family N-acetyltransferase [Paenibacillus sp. sptzw28]|uniref:GNAT family N-acetyltransferase n=1 Tax=Paenibacillus sp. sptzw28 TaxID=715179 RepID=UPI001C6E3A1C|nr:GNAT family N-acetyltransferase [Paenibacillus sp. sptzw28]QYR23504.1 GNAT family N-acetyltransferase [Paenibacillus sp. sptzw28]
MSELAFVEYTEDYLDAVLRTYNYYIEHTTFSFDLEPFTPDQMRQVIIPLNESYRSFVILVEGIYTGYVLITQHKKKPAYNVTGELTLYLELDQTGRGIGPRAVSFMEDVARKLRFHSLVATICEENEGSIRLFERLGYERVSHFKEVGYKFGRWLDIVSYQKIIKTLE